MADWKTLEQTLSTLDRVQSVADFSVTADGKTIAAAVSPAHREPDSSFDSRIWRVGTDSTEMDQLTFGPGSDTMPRWSPSGERLAFTSDRTISGRMDLFVVSPGEEPKSLGTIEGSVQDASWSADGSAVYVLAVDEGGFGAATDGAVRLSWSDPPPDPLVLSPPQGWRRLFRVDAATGETVEVGPGDVTVWEFDIVDDSTALAIVSHDPSENGWYQARLALLDLNRRDLHVVWTPEWQIQSPAADPTGAQAVLVEGWSSDRGLVAGDIRLIDLASGEAIALGVSDVNSLGWIDDETLWFAGWHELGSRFGVVGRDGDLHSETIVEGVVGPNSFYAQIQPVSDGVIAARDAPQAPPEISLHSDGEWKELTSLNTQVVPQLPTYPEVRELEWEGSGGLAIRGLALVPQGEPPFPTIVVLHGGPTWAWKLGFDPGYSLYLAAAGYCVFLPNYRGSTGRGQEFTKLNVGDPTGAEFEDILAGIDHCISLGLSTEGQLGVTGGSYGGYLTAWAATTTDRFQAAVMVSGITDMLSCHLTCNHAFAEHMFGGDHRNPDTLRLFAERSPITYAASATTPTLILHGTEDECTPTGQAQELHKALALNGVPTELVAYPREGHGFTEREHAFDSYRRTVGWFERFVEGEG